MAYRIMIGNHKGGTGKSAATINFAMGLAMLGFRVLVVDVDPQGNTTRRLGVPVDQEAAEPDTIAKAIRLAEPGGALRMIQPCGWDRKTSPWADLISVVPSRFDLEDRVYEAGAPGSNLRLARALEGADDIADFVLFDCPPSLGHLVQLVMAASTHALATVDPEYDGILAGRRFNDFIEKWAVAVGSPDLRVVGVLVQRIRNLAAHTYQVEGLGESFAAELVWEPHVPEIPVQKDASDAAESLTAYGYKARPLLDIWAEHTQHLVKTVGAAV